MRVTQHSLLRFNALFYNKTGLEQQIKVLEGSWEDDL